jgi:demethylmenaquinone methyltransferase/2-methoxy-6-polyprenyl-1,4-benzoquinol methylase
MDISENMLEKAAEDLKGQKYYDLLEFKVGNAMDIPFNNDEFEVITSAWLLRNVKDISTTLTEMKRVVKPGGKVISLDLGKPKSKLFKKIYDLYLYKFIHFLGRLVYGQKGPYDYLPESLKTYPAQDELAKIYEDVGFVNVRYHELTGGVIVVHMGEKPC